MKKVIFGLFFLLGLGVTVLAATSLNFYSQGLDGPESIRYDAQSEVFYISNVSGDGLKYDNEGWITKISGDGEVIKERWSSKGLHAPKGLGVLGGVLYVADINHLVLIDLATSNIVKKVFIESSIILNDVVTDEANQIVYVSDTMGNTIYKYSHQENIVSKFDQGDHLESPNGLFLQDDKLIVASWGKGIKADWSTEKKGSLFSIDIKTLEKSMIISNLGNLDGVEADPRNTSILFVSDWVAGTVYRVQGKAVVETFTDIEGAADIGVRLLNGKTEIYVPSMTKNKILKIDR